ncbi:MAG: TldD protein [archaeon GW2011_AR13]|nr:MAG: TldD protein [archaeon GW2011_AR13]HIG94127.1 TldD/PmbA family protein [Nanoarchaeota archaeon]HIH63944.1 TldD/PmbA family protein [Nanoarchaeota archaeon]HIJ09714.1 TldD/PmbA family protein [Nanoarchaeota archaeon]
MKEDKFLKVMEENVDKWLKAQLNINVFGKTLSTTLDYLSILYKEERDELQCFLNGIPDEKPNISFNNGFSIFTLVGDKKQGYGCARSARDSFPKDASLLGKLMQESLDLATKSAISFYLTAVGKNVIYDEDLFVKLSKETPETFLSKSSCSLKVDDSVRKMVKDFTEEMYSSGTVNESDGVIHIVNGSNRFVDSEGRKIRESRKLGTIGLEGKFNHSDGSLLNHFDNYVFTNKVDQEKLKTVMQNFYETVNELKVASVPVSKQYPVIFGGSALGTMIHEALGGHLLSGRYIQNKISTVFKNRIGSLVLPEFMTIIDNPQLKDSFGFYLFDDEGVASKKTVLIKNGVLQNYLLDRGSANYFGMNSNGHSRMEWVCRQSEENPGVIVPEPRVSNLEIISSNCVSEKELDQIVQNHCKKVNEECALYIEAGNGEVDIQTSEFRMFPSKAYKLFPDGKKEPIHNFMIIGNAYELLQQIVVTSNKLATTYGICGSSSGGIQTQEIAPSAFIPTVNIQAIESVKLKKRLI